MSNLNWLERIPGHAGIKINEVVDLEAKKAAIQVVASNTEKLSLDKCISIIKTR